MGVSMSSSYCKSLGNPHVTLLLNISSDNGQTKYHSMEMSVAQFQVMLCVLRVQDKTHIL